MVYHFIIASRLALETQMTLTIIYFIFCLGYAVIMHINLAGLSKNYLIKTLQLLYVGLMFMDNFFEYTLYSNAHAK